MAFHSRVFLSTFLRLNPSSVHLNFHSKLKYFSSIHVIFFIRLFRNIFLLRRIFTKFSFPKINFSSKSFFFHTNFSIIIPKNSFIFLLFFLFLRPIACGVKCDMIWQLPDVVHFIIIRRLNEKCTDDDVGSCEKMKKKFVLLLRKIYFKVEKFSLWGIKTLCAESTESTNCDDVVVGKM